MRARGLSVAVPVAILAIAQAVVLPHGSRAQEASPCKVAARVSLSRKLVCPGERVDVHVRVVPECPMGEQRVGIRSASVSLQLPPGLSRWSATTGEEEPGPDRLRWEVAFESGAALLVAREGITLTQAIVPLEEGTFRIGEPATVELVDALGRLLRGTAEPAVLAVGPCARPTGAALYLPVVERATCRPADVAADIVLLIDRSSSMGRAGGHVESARQAGAFLDMLDLSRQRVGVVAFDQRAVVVAPLGSDRSAIDRALLALETAPGTRIERAIRLGATELASSGRKRVLALVSDGVQTGPDGRGAVQAAAREAREQGVAIVTLALGPVADRELLVSIASNGKAPASADGPVGLAAAFRELAGAATCGR